MQAPLQTNRAFGFTIGAFFLILAGVGWLVFDAVWRWALIASGSLVAIALVWPGLLLVPNLFWRRLAGRVALLNTFLLLGAIFYTVISPVGLLMKLFRRDTMHRPFRSEATTYFTPVGRQVSAETLADQF